MSLSPIKAFLSPLWGKLGIYLLIGVIGLGSMYSWHRRIVRDAEQAARQSAYSEALEKSQFEYEQEKKKYQEQIDELNIKYGNLSKKKQETKIIIQEIIKESEKEIEKIESLDDQELIIDICSRLPGGCK